MSIVGEPTLRWLVVGFCGLQAMDYRVLNAYVVGEEERHLFKRPAPMQVRAYKISKYIGIITNLLVMTFAALNWPQMLPLVVPLHIAACLYIVAEMDVRAGIIVANGGPVMLEPFGFVTLLIIPNFLRLFTTWLVYDYWCLKNEALG